MRTIKVIQVIFGLLALVFWFSSHALFDHFDAVRPTQPNAATGEVYPQSNHGHVVYLSGTDRQYFFSLMALAVASFAISGILYLHMRSKRLRDARRSQ